MTSSSDPFAFARNDFACRTSPLSSASERPPVMMMTSAATPYLRIVPIAFLSSTVRTGACTIIVAFSSNATKGGAWSAAAAFSRSPPARGLSTASSAARAAFSSPNAFCASAALYFFDAACAGATAIKGGTTTGALNACSCNARRRETSTSTQLAHSRVMDAAVALSACIIFSLLNSTALRPQPLQRMLSAGLESIKCSVHA
mmetsp:Transcript_9297/g.27298  ORF Transcript_9297/g.27298 Transcript_9297/m.27298 type:complete len:202 (+) Transcript_9297:54-659(+)